MKKENPKIKIIREFKEYAYYNPLNVFKGLKKTGTNINIFGNQVAICISEEDISFYIWFGIVGDIFNTKKIGWCFKKYDTTLDVPIIDIKES